jgi:DNA-binding transcriptional regulator YiaG
MGKDKKKKDKKKHRQDEVQTPSTANKKTGAFDLRAVEIPAPPKPMKPAEIRALRAGMNASQALFARLLNVSSNAVESWEQGIREPRQATLKLLHIARKTPGSLLD